VIVVGGCSFKGTGTPADPIDGAGSIIADGGADASGMLAWSLHTKAELEDPGAEPTQPATIAGGVISSRDLIEPTAWTIGGLWTRASDTDNFPDPVGVTWATVTSYTPTAVAAIGLPVGNYYAATYPSGLGLTDADYFAVWCEGEIFLETGQHGFTLDADDAAFIELDVDGTTKRLEDRYSTNNGTLQVDVANSGWYPIRIAFGEFNTDAWLRIRHDPPGNAPDAPLAIDRLRYATTTTEGLVRTAFDSEELGRQRGVTRMASPLINEDYGNGAPIDLGLTSADYFSQRFAGQVWIDQAGTYGGQVISDDGFRLALDGTWVAGDLTGASQTAAIPDTAFERGWHDLVFDHQENGGSSHLELTLGGVPGDGHIPATVLRPVLSARERLAAGASTAGQAAIPTSMQVVMPAPGDAELVELTIVVNAPGAHWGDDTIDLQTPWGTTYRVRNRVDATGAVVVDRIDAAVLQPAGSHPVAGTWTVAVDDVGGGNDGNLASVELTARYKGGSPAIAATTTYTSGVHDFGAPQAVSGVTVRASTPPGSSATLALRACDALPCSGPFQPAGVFPLAASRYVQVQVELTSDGIAIPFVDDIDVYTAR